MASKKKKQKTKNSGPSFLDNVAKRAQGEKEPGKLGILVLSLLVY